MVCPQYTAKSKPVWRPPCVNPRHGSCPGPHTEPLHPSNVVNGRSWDETGHPGMRHRGRRGPVRLQKESVLARRGLPHLAPEGDTEGPTLPVPARLSVVCGTVGHTTPLTRDPRPVPETHTRSQTGALPPPKPLLRHTPGEGTMRGSSQRPTGVSWREGGLLSSRPVVTRSQWVL